MHGGQLNISSSLLRMCHFDRDFLTKSELFRILQNCSAFINITFQSFNLIGIRVKFKDNNYIYVIKIALREFGFICHYIAANKIKEET